MRLRGALTLLFLTACGSSSSNGGASSGAGGSSGAGANLAGTWDFQGTQGSKMQSGTITLDSESIVIAATGGTLSIARNGAALSVTYTDGVVTETAQGLQTSGGMMSLGIFPFDISGTFTFTEVESDPGRVSGTCHGALTKDEVGADCEDVGVPPRPVPRRLNGTLTSDHVKVPSDTFGDLGGLWTTQTPEGALCSISFHDNIIDGMCSAAANLTGRFTFTFSGNMVSGTTSTGVELSAQRR